MAGVVLLYHGRPDLAMTSPASVPPGRWRFGQFELDLATRELRKNGLRIRIQEQQARILEALIERAGELVTREDLRERLWPADTFVDFERSLNAAVAKLRQVLADSAEQPRYVETVARRGYRFVAPVQACAPAQESAEPSSDSIAAEAVAPTPTRSRRLWVWPVAALGVLVLASSFLFRTGPRAASSGQPPPVSFVIPPPEGTRIHPMSAVSADGTKVAFVAVDPSGHRTLWVRALASESSIRLPNTDEAITPFFSADSQHIGYFADGKLKRIPTLGGSAQTLCNVNQPAGGTWNRENVIVFSQLGRLYRVSAGGGPSTELVRPDTLAGQIKLDTWPQFLPDGRHFIVSTATHTGTLNAIRTEILLGAIDSKNRKWLVNSRSRAALTPLGRLLFRRDDSLVAQTLDLSRERLVGEPVAVAQDLNRVSGGVFIDVKPGMPNGVVPAPFSASDNGVLVYHASPPPRRQLVWFNREGKRLGVAGESRDYMQIVLSPDEQWAALAIRNARSLIHWNIWLLLLSTNVLSRLTFGEGRDADPAWSPQSDRVVYGAYQPEQGEKIDLMQVTLGEPAPKRIYSDGDANKPEVWSPDNRYLLFRRNEQTVLTLPTSGDRNPAVLLHSPYIKQGFRFSPDGHWVAYASTDSGAEEIYVASFPGMTGTRQVSTGGGYSPVWRKDGQELFYMTELGDVMSTGVKAGSTLVTRSPKLLFHADSRNANMPQFAVTENGQKFLVIESPSLRVGDERMIVVTHWDAPVRQ